MRQQNLSAWLYVAPLMLVLVPFFLLPTLVVLVASFFETDGFGGLLHKGWEMKRSLGGISYARIDDCYERARAAGAIGGKLAGAGGGGFLVLYCPPDRQAAVCDALSDLKRVDFQFDRAGARVAFAE